MAFTENQSGQAYYVRFANAARGTVVEIRPSMNLLKPPLEVRESFNQPVSEAEVHLTAALLNVTYWDKVQIWMGATPATMRLWFTGYVVPIEDEYAPIEQDLHLRGRLIRAVRKTCDTEGGLDLVADHNAGALETTMIGTILDACGLDREPGYSLEGTGRLLGTEALVISTAVLTDEQATPYAWKNGQPGWNWIRDLDEISVQQNADGVWAAYRTRDRRNGQIVRTLVLPVPAAAAVATFTEGVDIYRGRRSRDPNAAKTKAIVTGWADALGVVSASLSQANPVADPWADGLVTDISNDLIEFATAAEIVSDKGIAAEEVCQYLLTRDNRVATSFPFVTRRDDGLEPYQTFAVVSPTRLGETRNYWLGAIKAGIYDDGWQMELTGVGGDGSSAPFVADLLVGFDMLVEQETIVSGGVETTLYVVSCTADASSPNAEISTYAWTATGGTPSSGSASTFVTSYTSLAGKSIALQVIDALGAAKTCTRTVPSGTDSQIVHRKLYVAGTTELAAYDADASTPAWNSEAATAGTVVANGPIWADGDTVHYSTDELATASSTSQPKAGTNITALWMETDISTTVCLAGLADGSVYVSRDSGATWTSAGTPEASAILKVVINRYSPDLTQWFALTASAYYDTVDGGASWTALQSADVGETFRDVAHHYDRGYMLVMSGGRLAVDSGGTQQTITASSGDIVAICPRVGGGYALYDSNGKTYLCENGATTFTATASALPTGSGLVVQARGLWLDRGIQDLYYVAGGSGGCWKSIDGFGSAGGYFTIRVPGVGSAPVGAVYTQVGADGLLTTPTSAGTVLYSGTGAKAKSLWNGSNNDDPPSGWSDPSFNDSAWSAAVSATLDGGSPVSGSTAIWSSARPATVTGSGSHSTAYTFTGDGVGPLHGYFELLIDGSHANGHWAVSPGDTVTIQISIDDVAGSDSNGQYLVDILNADGSVNNREVFETNLTEGQTGVVHSFTVPVGGAYLRSIAQAPTGRVWTWRAAFTIGAENYANEECLTIQTGSIPSGLITSASLALKVNDDCKGVWIDGMFVDGSVLSNADATLDVTRLVKPGTTVTIAVWGLNTADTATAWISYALTVS